MGLFIGIVAALAFSALFSGSEMAFVSANKLKIELKKKKGSYRSLILSGWYDGPNNFISTMLVGNNIALVVYGFYMPEVLNPFLPIDNPYLLLLLQTILSTILILIFAEFLPKAIFSNNANRLL